MTVTPFRLLRQFYSTGSFVVLLSLLLISGTSRANEISLAVNLGLSSNVAAEKYKPVVDYFAQVTGKKIRLELNANPFAHWERMRRDGYDMVIDNPAFTAYRIARMDYTVVGKLPDVLSFSLVTHVDEMMLEPGELIGRSLATVPSPSISALRLEQIYSNPMRQPSFIQVEHYSDALDLVMNGRAAGAMVPTGLLGRYVNLNPIYTSEQIPAPGISVSARISPELRDTIRQALLDAHKTEAGRAMLDALNVPQIEAASNDTYAGIESLLEGLFGY
jgi:phosphonate transport system substrate-binding protein